MAGRGSSLCKRNRQVREHRRAGEGYTYAPLCPVSGETLLELGWTVNRPALKFNGLRQSGHPDLRSNPHVSAAGLDLQRATFSLLTAAVPAVNREACSL